MRLQAGVVLTARVSGTRAGQELVRLESEAVLLLGGGRAGAAQEFVRLNGGHGLLSPGVAGQRAAEGPVCLRRAHVLRLDGAGTSPPQELVCLGDAVLLRFQFGFAFSTTRGRITWRPSKPNSEHRANGECNRP